MASTYTTSLKIQEIGNGEQSGIWGSTTNSNWVLIEQAVSGVQTIVMANADYALTNLNGVLDEARNMTIVATGTNSAVYKIVAPLVPKFYVVSNQTTGGYAITVGGASGSYVTIPNGFTSQVYCDGINFYAAQTSSGGNWNVVGNETVSGNSTVSGNLTVAGTATVAGNKVDSFVSGTTLLFYQAAAPTGWTQVTTQNDAALRIVSGTGGTAGGSVGFLTAFASQAVSGSLSQATGTTDGHTLTTAEIPSHSHGVNDPSHSHLQGTYNARPVTGTSAIYGTNDPTPAPGSQYTSAASTGISIQSTGGGGAHSHTFTAGIQTFTGTAINLAVKYINVIMASKN